MTTKVELRQTPFRKWFAKHLKEESRGIAEHGADAGWAEITYTSDTVKLYNRFEEDIYEMLNEDADEMGYDSPEALIATFRRKDMLSTPDMRKNLLVWFACEKVAREMNPDL